MPTGCAALACPSVWKKHCEYSFHRFPLDAERRKEWLWHLNRKNYSPSLHTFLCSKHFEDSWFDRTGQTIRLRANAVPTIFSFPENVCQKVSIPRNTKKRKIATVSKCKPADISEVKPTIDPQMEHKTCEDHKEHNDCEDQHFPIPQDSENSHSPTVSKCKPAALSNSIPTTISNSKPATVSYNRPATCSNVNPNTDLQTAHNNCEDHNYYLQSLSAAKRKIDDLERRLEIATKKIKHCQQRERRMNTKCNKMKCLLEDLKKKCLSEESAIEVIESSLDGLSLEILRNEMSNHSKDPHGHRYSSGLIEFCLTLHACSPKAYEYVRRHLAIPHPHTLRKWVDISDGNAGSESLSNSPPPQ